MDRHPDWLLQLIAGLATYDEMHPKLFRSAAGDKWLPTDCPCGLLQLVPDDVRAYARGWAAGRESLRCSTCHDEAEIFQEGQPGGPPSATVPCPDCPAGRERRSMEGSRLTLALCPGCARKREIEIPGVGWAASPREQSIRAEGERSES